MNNDEDYGPGGKVKSKCISVNRKGVAGIKNKAKSVTDRKCKKLNV